MTDLLEKLRELAATQVEKLTDQERKDLETKIQNLKVTDERS